MLDSGEQSFNPKTQAIGSPPVHYLDKRNEDQVPLHHRFCLQSAPFLESFA